MALTELQARELRSLMQAWQKASTAVGELLRGGAVTTDGLDMPVVRKAMDQRAQAEALLLAFWSVVVKT
ncbi:MAG: hypothetical protein FJ029_03615 [Actinobacteria bacterium]|nr:hypothetical protein [Actinomycetota bacterium]